MYTVQTDLLDNKFIFPCFFRSPWSNSYEPPLDDGAMPSERLRKLEIDANAAFDQYREMYFEGGVSSVYLWDLDHGFAGQYHPFKN
jgi:capping protein beta